MQRTPPPGVLEELQSGALAEIAPRIEFWKGMQIGKQGTPCSQLYIVASGQVLLSRRDVDGVERPLFLLGPGDLFGEGSLRPERVWLANSRAVTDGSAHVLPAAQFPRLAQYYPRLTNHIIRLLADRLERSHRRLDLVRGSSARERLVGLLRVVAEHHGVPEGDRTWVPLALTQEDLGKMIGLARETVARLLADLEESGAIRRESGGLWILPEMEKENSV